MATASTGTRSDEPHRSELTTLEALYDAYHRQATGLAYRPLGNRAAAEDVVQDAFLSVWRSLDRYDPSRGSLRAWLLASVRHRALDALRARRRHPLEPLFDDQSGADPGDVAAQVAALLDCERLCAGLDALPGEQRSTIELAYFSGLSQTEIAALAAQPLGTIKGRVRLGLSRLRALVLQSPQPGAA